MDNEAEQQIIPPTQMPTGYVGIWPPPPEEPTVAPCELPMRIRWFAFANAFNAPFRGKGQVSVDSSGIVVTAKGMLNSRLRVVVLAVIMVVLWKSPYYIPALVGYVIVFSLPIMRATRAIAWSAVKSVVSEPAPGHVSLFYEVAGTLGLKGTYFLPLILSDADRGALMERAAIMAPGRVAQDRLRGLPPRLWIMLVAAIIVALVIFFMPILKIIHVP